MNKAFARRAVNNREPRIRFIVGWLLDDIEDPAGFDFMKPVAQPLPVIAITGMLGVPAQDTDRFRIWSARRARLLEPTIGPRERRDGEATSKAFDGYSRPIIEERRPTPRYNIVSTLTVVQDDGGGLSERETLNMLRLLLIAGQESTANRIGERPHPRRDRDRRQRFHRRDQGPRSSWATTRSS